MTRFTKDEVQKAYALLHESVREVIHAVETNDKVLAIGDKEDLHLDQIGKLAEEIDYLLIGLTKREEFARVLMRELGVDEAKATAIARDVNDEILADIRSALRERTDAPSSEAENRKQEAGSPTPSVLPSPTTSGSSSTLGDGKPSSDEREAMLRELENPTATPISGRRMVVSSEERVESTTTPEMKVSEKVNVSDEKLPPVIVPESNPPSSEPTPITNVKVEPSKVMAKPPVDPYREIPT